MAKNVMGMPVHELDGDVHYRDTHDGDRVAVLPRTCARRRHDQTRHGYRVAVVDRVQELFMTCAACAPTPPHPDDVSWCLRTGGHTPIGVVLDDEPYRAMLTHEP